MNKDMDRDSFLRLLAARTGVDEHKVAAAMDKLDGAFDGGYAAAPEGSHPLGPRQGSAYVAALMPWPAWRTTWQLIAAKRRAKRLRRRRRR